MSRPKSLFDKLDIKGYRPIETVEMARKDPLNHIPYEKIMKEYVLNKNKILIVVLKLEVKPKKESIIYQN